MKFLIDINHPAHVHFFRNPIRMLTELGHEVATTSRDKEMAVPLLDALGIEHHMLSVQKKGGGLFALGKELIARDVALYRVVRKFRPNAMAAIGGTFVAHVGFMSRVPSLVFYDTENAKLQNAITYPFATRVLVPRCYSAWLPRSAERYPGYHELSYLHPKRFKADKAIAIAAGLDAEKHNFFLRTVSWNANHDIGERGWSEKLLERVTHYLASIGTVHISSEAELPAGLAKFKFAGKVADVHHLMAFCRLFVGESATMASESAVLGVPAIYAANTGRGYTDEQESKYRLVRNLRDFDWDALKNAIDEMLLPSEESWRAKRESLVADTIDVAPFVVDSILRYARH
jgi:predicted glycosyltransferase